MEEKPGSSFYLTFTVCDLKKQLSLVIFVNASFSNFWGEMMGLCFLFPSLITQFRHKNVCEIPFKGTSVHLIWRFLCLQLHFCDFFRRKYVISDLPALSIVD